MFDAVSPSVNWIIQLLEETVNLVTVIRTKRNQINLTGSRKLAKPVFLFLFWCSVNAQYFQPKQTAIFEL